MIPFLCLPSHQLQCCATTLSIFVRARRKRQHFHERKWMVNEKQKICTYTYSCRCSTSVTGVVFCITYRCELLLWLTRIIPHTWEAIALNELDKNERKKQRLTICIICQSGTSTARSHHRRVEIFSSGTNDDTWGTGAGKKETWLTCIAVPTPSATTVISYYIIRHIAMFVCAAEIQ